MLSVGDKESWILQMLMWFVAKFTVERNAHSQLKVSENKNVNVLGFPDSSVGKESACNAGDLGSIPGLGISPGEGKGYPLQYSGLENSHGQRSLAGYGPRSYKSRTPPSPPKGSSLVGQLVKYPAMRETWVRSLGWEDAPETGKATHSSILA